MFGEFPKLFGKDFAVGYFLPVSLFFIANIAFLTSIGLVTAPVQVVQTDLLIGTTFITLLLWLTGVLLIILNRHIYRLFEGYGIFNPFRVFGRFEKRRFAKLNAELADLDKRYWDYSQRKIEYPVTLSTRRAQILVTLAEKYPDSEAYLLPTSFGNILRSFERYPQVMYGIEVITGWTRLQAAIPKDFQESTDSAKAQTDFWLNLLFLSLLFYIESTLIVLLTGSTPMLWIPLAISVVMIFAYSGACSAAIEWGDSVKASFDLYLPKLYEILKYPIPATREEEIEFWTAFSRAITFRDPEDLRDRGTPSSSMQPNLHHNDE